MGVTGEIIRKPKQENPYNEKYAAQEHYWGKTPSVMCDQIIELIHPSSEFHPMLLDLGCGEGRNAVYFAKHGFRVFSTEEIFECMFSGIPHQHAVNRLIARKSHRSR